MAAFDSQLKAIIDSVNPAEEFVAWLKTLGALEIEGVALLAPTEEKLEALFDTMKGAGVPTEALGNRLKIKKVWSRCRAAHAAGTTGGAPSSTQQDALPDGVARSLKDLWTSQHHFTILATRLLAVHQVRQIHEAIHASPRTMPSLVISKMKLSTYGQPTNDQEGLLVRPGHPVEAVQPEEVKATFDVFIRIRAFFTTVAYTSIDQVEFFDYQSCEGIVDNIFFWLYKRHKGERPNLAFFLDAFTSTMQIFQEAVRNGRPLKAVVNNYAEYQHHWTVYVPNGQDNTQQEGGHAQKRPRDQSSQSNEALKNDLNNLKEALRKVQSEKDKEIARLRSSLDMAGKSSNSQRSKPWGKGKGSHGRGR